jgi:hypothetical protein
LIKLVWIGLQAVAVSKTYYSQALRSSKILSRKAIAFSNSRFSAERRISSSNCSINFFASSMVLGFAEILVLGLSAVARKLLAYQAWG